MIRRNLITTLVLVLSAMGLLFALFCGLIASDLTSQHQWLTRTSFLLGLAAAALTARLLMRNIKKAAVCLPERLKKNWYYSGLTAILALGLILRLLVINGLPITPDSDYETYFRLGKFLKEGTLLKEGGKYLDYVAEFPHTLGYPLLILKPVFSVFGTSVPIALYANMVIGLLNILLTALIGRRLCGRACGLLAGTLMSVWPSHVLYSGLVSTEPSYTFMMLATLFAAFILFRQGEDSVSQKYPLLSLCLYAALGLLLCAAGMIRPMSAIALTALIITVTFRLKNVNLKEQGLSRQILDRGYLCALLMLSSYILGSGFLASLVESEVKMPLASGINASGYSLMVGTNTESYGMWNPEDSAFFEKAYRETGFANAAHRTAIDKALDRISEDPMGMLKLAIEKYAILWQGDDFGADWLQLFSSQQGSLTDVWALLLKNIRVLGRFLYLWVLLLAAMLLPFLFKKPRQEYITLFLIFLGTAALHMVLETQPRYHYTVLPMLILLASASVFQSSPAYYYHAAKQYLSDRLGVRPRKSRHSTVNHTGKPE